MYARARAAAGAARRRCEQGVDALVAVVAVAEQGVRLRLRLRLRLLGHRRALLHLREGAAAGMCGYTRARFYSSLKLLHLIVWRFSE